MSAETASEDLMTIKCGYFFARQIYTIQILNQISENLLAIYLDEYDETPWDALKYLIAGICYGGHITDDMDR